MTKKAIIQVSLLKWSNGHIAGLVVFVFLATPLLDNHCNVSTKFVSVL